MRAMSWKPLSRVPGVEFGGRPLDGERGAGRAFGTSFSCAFG